MDDLVFTNRNVYIFGAGFSVDAGLPVVNEFMNVMRDSLSWLRDQKREREAEAVSSVLKFRLKAAAASYRVHVDVENIEELFSLASASVNSGGTDVPLAIAATLSFAARTRPKLPDVRIHCSGTSSSTIHAEAYLNSFEGTPSHFASPYDYYLGLACGFLSDESPDRRDTIITFNYDLAAEDALLRLKIPFTYGASIQRICDVSARCARREEKLSAAISVLKLHGSVNWAAPHPRIPMGFSNPTEPAKVYGNCEDVLAANRQPLLVPPTWRKSFSNELSGIWDEAVSALQTATRIIVIGYSLPLIDYHLKYLLAAGLQDNASLRTLLFVNPLAEKPEGEALLRERLFSHIRHEYTSEIAKILPRDTLQFFSDPHCRKQSNRDLFTNLVITVPAAKPQPTKQ